jgi:hypothetical protein
MTAHVVAVVSVLSLVVPAVAAAQNAGGRVSLRGAFGSSVNVGGNAQALSVGFSLGNRVDILINGERIHMPTEVTQHERGFSSTRGGTTTFVSGEVQVLPFTLSRVSPYALAGVGRGISRPNVNDLFPDPVTNDAGLLFFGGGVRVPVTDRLSVFGDLRFVLQIESAGDGDLFLFVPVRGGVVWRF